MRFELLISEKTGSILVYPVRTKKQTFMLILITSHLCFEYHCINYTNTTSNQSQEFISHIKQRFMTTGLLTYVTNGIQDFIKCCIKSRVHLDLPPDNMPFGGLQPVGSLCCKSTHTNISCFCSLCLACNFVQTRVYTITNSGRGKW